MKLLSKQCSKCYIIYLAQVTKHRITISLGYRLNHKVTSVVQNSLNHYFYEYMGGSLKISFYLNDQNGNSSGKQIRFNKLCNEKPGLLALPVISNYHIIHTGSMLRLLRLLYVTNLFCNYFNKLWLSK